MDNFFLSTHIPIKAFDLNGGCLGSIGYEDQLEKIFEINHVYEEGKKQLLSNLNSTFTTLQTRGKLSFTITPICCKDINGGIFIMGPYTSCRCRSTKEILYKPSNCIPHLVTLLHNFRKDQVCLKFKKAGYDGLYFSPYVRRTIDYIEENYHNPITLDEITEYLNINRCYFCTIFKKETNKTFTQFLNEIRIEKSKKLLIETKQSILDIALQVGFNNANYFSMSFKKLTSKTPLQYRKDVT